jgi:hypothetical protein
LPEVGSLPRAWGILLEFIEFIEFVELVEFIWFTPTCVGNTKCRKQDLTPITHDSSLRLPNISEEK